MLPGCVVGLKLHFHAPVEALVLLCTVNKVDYATHVAAGVTNALKNVVSEVAGGEGQRREKDDNRDALEICNQMH